MTEYIEQKRKFALRSYIISIPLLLIIGVAFIFIGITFPDKFVHSNMIFSIGIGLIFADIVVFAKYLYWKKNREAHEKLLQDEKIKFSDERKIMLRQKSGQVAYQWTLIGLFALNMIFTFAGIDMTIILALWLFIAADFVFGIVLFQYYSKKM